MTHESTWNETRSAATGHGPRSPRHAAVAVAACLALGQGCGGDGLGGNGAVIVGVGGEETIAEGLRPAGAGGDDAEAIVDGWRIDYDRYLIVVANVTIARSTGGEALRWQESTLVDLTETPQSGTVLTGFSDVEPGRWDRVSWESVAADGGTTLGTGATAAERETMIAEELSSWVGGVAQKDGRSIAFDFRIAAPTRWSDCEAEEGTGGDLGFAVPEGRATAAELSVHGDHFWFDAFPAGIEDVRRRADWLARVDDATGGDGTVDGDDLASVGTGVFVDDAGDPYSLSGSPIDIVDGQTWVQAQGVTVGHFQGEGECAWSYLGD